jgi:SHAQKYF class myb-like DNA-binding protein
MEQGGQEIWNTYQARSEGAKSSTAVQSFIEQSNNTKSKSQELSPESYGNSDRKTDGYRNPIIWDATTVSSKKNPSFSPPNQRQQVEEIPVYPVVVKRKSVKNNSAKSSTSYAITEVRQKDKSKNTAVKRKKRNYESIAKAKATKGHYNSGRWTRLEHFKFLEALKIFGKEWQKVQQHVFTRTSTQARSHAQKFFVKLDKKQLTLEEFLEKLDIEQLKLDLKLDNAGDSTEYDEDAPLITIINLKNKGSVMNIALPGEAFKVEQAQNQALNQDNSNVANEFAMSNMVAEEEEIWNTQCGTKRSSMQRKAKTNHTFLYKNYSESKNDSFKRKKTGVDDEELVKCENDTKIWINQYALENMEDDSESRPNHEITGVHDYEKDLRSDSDIDDILDNAGHDNPEEPSDHFNYYESDVNDEPAESIDELIGSKPKKEFNLMPPDCHLISMHLLSQQHDWKLESINYTISKQIKNHEGLKLETNEEVSLLKDPNHMSLMDQF